MAPLCRVMPLVMLAVLLGACHTASSVEATDVTLPSTTTTTITTTSTTVKDDIDVVNVSEKETVVAPTDMPTAVSNATSLPPVKEKIVDEKLPSPSPSPSTVGDKEKEGEDKEKEGEDKEDEAKEETDKEKKEKGEPLEVDDMLKDPYRNKTVEDSTTAHPDKDTVTVVDSHVVDLKKTHEEEAANNETTTGSPPIRITDNPASRVFYSESTIATPVMALVVDHSDHDHLTPGKTSPFAQSTATAAILAGVLVGIAVAGYVGLVTWRKFLEKRYGNREMLVNEDDDIHHFEL